MAVCLSQSRKNVLARGQRDLQGRAQESRPPALVEGLEPAARWPGCWGGGSCLRGFHVAFTCSLRVRCGLFLLRQSAGLQNGEEAP